MKSLECEKCGGPLVISADGKIGSCEFCGTKVLLLSEEERKIENLLKRGEDALDEGAFRRAERYFDLVLDIDRDNGDACMGKVLAQEECCTLENLLANLKQEPFLMKKDKIPVTACPEDKIHVNEAVKRFTIDGFLSGLEIAKLYQGYDRTFLSGKEAYIRQILRKKYFLDGSSLAGRAAKYAIGETGELLRKEIKEIRKIQEENQKKYEKEEADQIQMIQEGYEHFLESADEKAKELYLQAWEKRDEKIKEKAYEELHEKERKEQLKKILRLTSAVIILISVILAVRQEISNHQAYQNEVEAEAAELEQQKQAYKNAGTLLEQGKELAAAISFGKAGDYEDAKARSLELWHQHMPEEKSVSISDNRFAGVKTDGTAIAAGQNNYKACQVEDWRDVTAIRTSTFRTVGLKKDGTTVAVGENQLGGCTVGTWQNILQIRTNFDCSFGLTKDGTVKMAGYVSSYEDLEQYDDIVQIDTQESAIVGLRSDGTVVFAGYNNDNKYQVEDWEDVIAITTGANTIAGIKLDGSVVVTGDNEEGQCDTKAWTDITQVALSSFRTVGLKADGTVVATGSNHWGACNTSDWHDIVSVATGINFTAGLKSDGTVVLVGRCSTGESPTKDWQNVCQIAASSTMLVGITEEGSLLMAGSPSNWNQSYTYSSAEWTNLKTD